MHTLFWLQTLKICTTYLFHYTSAPDLHEAHIANQQYSLVTMADNLFSSALPPSLPHTISPLNNNTNEVSLQEKHQNMDKNWLMLHQCSTWRTHLPPQDHCHPSVTIPSYPHLLQHTHAVMLAIQIPPQKEQLLLRINLSIPPTDTTVLILKILSTQAQRLWRQRRFPPKLSHHASAQTSLTKTWCGAIHLTAIPLQEETTLTSYQSPLLPHPQNQPNRISHLAMSYPLRLSTSRPYMIINQR